MPSPSTRFGLFRMHPRSPEEPHRASTPLELFFDLVFVVAVSNASGQLGHADVEGHVAQGLGTYFLAFFSIWWAWMNFTWFASAFATEDWLYRVLTFVQMAGVLIVAAGVANGFADGDWTLGITGYVVMRLVMVAQWLRASRSHPDYRIPCLTYAIGIAIVQVLWVCWLLFVPAELQTVTFLILAVAEISIPIIAERRQSTPYHLEHIAERYGLFTLIVLGESVLASTNAMIDAFEHQEHLGSLIMLAIYGFVLVCGIWWIYFANEHTQRFSHSIRSIVTGYGHFFIFASVAAFSAGIEAEIAVITGSSELSPIVAGSLITIPVAIVLFGVWLLDGITVLGPRMRWVQLMLIIAIGASAFLGIGPAVAAAVMVISVVITEWMRVRADELNQQGAIVTRSQRPPARAEGISS